MSEKSFVPHRKRENGVAEKEKEPNNFDILSSEELRALFLNSDGELIDDRFASGEDVFKYFDLEDTGFQLNGSEIVWPVIKNEKGEIVGICKLVKHRDDVENKRYMYFLSVDPKFQGQGYASKLVDNLFKYLKENNLFLEMSSYTSEHSWERLRPLFDRYSQKYGVKLLENDKKMGWK